MRWLYQQPFWQLARLAGRRVQALWLRSQRDHLSLWASSLSFYALFSLVPIGIFATLLVDHWPTGEFLKKVYRLLIEHFAPQRVEVLQKNWLLSTQHRQAMGGVSFFLLLWSSLRFFEVIESGLNYIFGESSPPGKARGKIIGLLLLLLLSILGLGALIISLTATTLWRWGTHLLFGYTLNPPLIVGLASLLLSFTLSLAFFTSIYRFLPRNPPKGRALLIGAGFSSLGLEILKHFFAFLTSHMVSIGIAVSVFGGAVLFIFWIYLGALIFFLGAEIAAETQNPLVEGK